MFLRIQKNALRLIAIASLLGILFTLPDLLERKLATTLKLNQWHTELIEKIQSNADFHFTIQGVYLDIFQGIHLKGIHLQAKNQNYQFQAENALIEFSLPALIWNWTQPKFQSIQIWNAKLQLDSYQPSIFFECRNALRVLQKRVRFSHTSLNIPISLNGLHVAPFKQRSLSVERSFHADIHITPPKALKSNQVALKTEAPDDSLKEMEQLAELSIRDINSNTLDWHINIEGDTAGNYITSFRDVPVAFLQLYLHYYNWSKESGFLKKYTQFQAGTFSGTALLKNLKGHLTKTIPNTTQNFIIDADYKGVNATLKTEVLPDFYMQNATGKVSLKIELENTLTSQTKQEEAQKFNYELSIKQPEIDLSISKKAITPNSYKKGEKKEYSNSYSIKGKANSSKDKKGFYIENITGEFDFDFQFIREAKKERITPYGNLFAKNIRIPLKFIASDLSPISSLSNKLTQEKQSSTTDNANFSKSASDIFLKTFSIGLEQKEHTQIAQVSAEGTCLNAKLTLNGKGNLNFTTDSTEGLAWTPQIELNVVLAGLNLQKVLSSIQSSTQQILEGGAKLHIRKHLEIEHNEFLNSSLYRNFLAKLRLNANIELHELKAAYPIPPRLNFRASTSSSYLRLELLPPANYNADFQTDFRYALYYHSNLPRHDLDLHVKLNHNKLSIGDLFTKSKVPPQNISLEYRFDGYGLLPADIIRRSYSYMRFQTNQLTFANQRILKAINHVNDIKKDSVDLNSLFISRASSGISISINFRGQTEQVFISGSGNYDIGLGGNIGYTLQRRKIDGLKFSNKRLSMRVLPFGKWVPNI